MFDLICVFTTGGVVLWFKAFCEIGLGEINSFVKDILINQKISLLQYLNKNRLYKWRIVKEFNLVFAVFFN